PRIKHAILDQVSVLVANQKHGVEKAAVCEIAVEAAVAERGAKIDTDFGSAQEVVSDQENVLVAGQLATKRRERPRAWPLSSQNDLVAGDGCRLVGAEVVAEITATGLGLGVDIPVLE